MPFVDFVRTWALETWGVLLEAGPWLLGGFLAAGVIYAVVSIEKVTRHLGRPGIGGVLKAALVGVPLPLCSCSVIPVASSIRKQGASRGATASFLISTPESGVDSIAISYALLGPFMAVARAIAAFVTAVIAGVIIDRLPKRPTHSQTPDSRSAGEPSSAPCCHSSPEPKPAAQSSSCCHSTSSTCEPETPSESRSAVETGWGSAARRMRVALRYGFVDMFKDLAHWLVLGFSLAGLVSAILPETFFTDYLGTGLLSMLVMAGAGLPMYVCATASTPVAAALMAKGLSAGGALVFLLVGPATNVATMVVVARDLGLRSLIAYLGSILAVALTLGLGTDYLLGHTPLNVDVEGITAHAHHGPVAIAGAVLLLIFIANGLGLTLRDRCQQRSTSRRNEQDHGHEGHPQPTTS